MPLKEKIKNIILKIAKPFQIAMEKIHITITVFAILSSIILMSPQIYGLLSRVGPEQFPIIPGIIGGLTLLLGAFIIWKKT